jgi:Anti-sigma regulatory factor (Ser/Thr protein kinase)
VKNEHRLNLLYPIINNDFYAWGQASSKLKTVLQELHLQSHIIRRIAICSYEAEINVIMHAYYGHIQASIYSDHTELLISDVGPGITDIDLAMQPGYSTATDYIRSLGFGSGLGLSTIDNYANKFSVHSQVGHGAKIYIMIKHY